MMDRTSFRRCLLAITVFLAAMLSLPAHAVITITNTGTAPTFYTDSSKLLVCNYLAFSVNSTTSVADLWVTIGSFTGAPARLSNGGGDDGLYHLGLLSAGGSKPAFFYVCSSLTGGGTATGQGYTITTYDRDPGLPGANNLGAQVFGTAIDDGLIAAAANKVTVVVSGPNPATLGGLMTITVEGDTGTIGSAPGPNGPLSFTPASFATWAASAFELFFTTIQFSGGNSGVYDNQLYFTTLANGSDSHYVATYYFRAVSTTAAPTAVSPIVHIASGGNIKHTDTSGFASLEPIAPSSHAILISKSVDVSTLPAQGGAVQYTVTIINGASYSISLDQVQDTLPSGASYVPSSSSYNNIAVSDPAISGQLLAWANPFSVPANASRALRYQAILPAIAGVYVNRAIGKISSTQIDTTYDLFDNAPASATTRVLQSLATTKTFSPTSADAAVPSSLTITLTNNNTGTTLNGVAISDTYPGNVVNASTTGYATTCPGATLSGGVPGGNTIGLTGVTLAPGASCVVSISVVASTAGAYVNTTSAPTSNNGGTGAPASATYYVPSTPTVTKTITPSTVAFGAVATLSLQVVNSSVVNNLTGVSFSDAFPSGLQVAATPALSNTCGGSVSGATAASVNVSLSGGSVPANSTCLITLAVTATTAGSYVNAASGVTSTQTGGPGPASNAATLRVLAPANVMKAFAPATIAINNDVSTLTITLTNPNSVDLAGAAFTDTYPAGIVNGATPAGATTCAGGSVTAAAGGGSVSLSGASIAASGSCNVTVVVKGTATGTLVNTIAAGGLTTTNGGASTAAATASLTVNRLVSIAKAFSVVTTLGSATYGVTTLTITLTNNNTGVTALGLAYTDTLPSGLLVATTPSATSNCGGSFQSSADGVTWGAVTAGHRYLRLTGGSISFASVTASCVNTVRVETTSGGRIYANQTSGVTSTTPAGTGTPSNIARLTPPMFTKAFSPTTIGSGGVSTMSIIVVNIDTTQGLSSISFTDAYPAGIDSGGGSTAKFTNATPVSFSNGCGGTLQSSANGTTWTAMTAGHTYLRLSGVSLAAGANCGIEVAVTGTVQASYPNKTSKIVTAQGVGGTAADVLYIARLPTVAKAFTPTSIAFGAASTMSLVVTNNYTAAVTGLALSDSFPAGMQIANPPNATSNCSATLESSANGTTWGGVTAGHAYFRMRAAASVASGAACTVTVRVTSAVEGIFDNQSSGAFYTSPTAGAAQPNVPGPRSNTATLTVYLNPATVTKVFGASVVPANAPVTLSVTVSNPNGRALNGVTVTDAYPANLVNTAPSITSNTCGGTVSAPSGGSSLSLVAGTIAASSSCTLTARVIALAAGTYTNVIGAGAVNAANATANTMTASAQVIATIPATIAKAFSPTSIATGGVASVGLTITNPNPVALTGVAFSDTLPSGLLIAASPVPFNGCGGTLAAAAGAAVITLSGASLGTSGSCVVSVPVTASVQGTYVNTADAVSSSQTSAGGPSNSATLTVIANGLFGAVYLDNDINGSRGALEDWSAGITLYVKLATRSGATCTGPALSAVTVAPGAGNYTFTGVASGDYCLILDNNATLSDITHTLPAGWFTTIPVNGVWFATVGTGQSGFYNFGLINSSRIAGAVFADNGAGAGTANDGVRNGTELGIASVPVSLTNCAATTYGSVFTASNGDYVFRVPSGATTLCVVQTNLAAYISTGASITGTQLPSGSPASVGGTSYTYTRPSDTLQFTNTANTSYSGINFGDVPVNTFAASGWQQGQAGNVVFYAHTYVANSSGQVVFTATVTPKPVITGWGTVIYHDVNCNGLIDVGENTILGPSTPIALTAGQSVCIVVRQFIPDSAPFGAQNIALIDAAFTYTNANPSLSASRNLTDVTQVAAAAILRLRKEVCNLTTSTCVALSGTGFGVSSNGRPGDELQYRIIYSNASSESLTALVVNDVTPPFSVRAAAPAAFVQTPAGLTPGAITAPAAGAAGSVAWPFSGLLLSGASGIVTFNIVIQ